jgi:hypothetical protein
MAMMPFTTTATNVPAGPAIFNAWAVGANMPPMTALMAMNWLSLDNCDTKRVASVQRSASPTSLVCKAISPPESCEVLVNLLQLNLVCHLKDVSGLMRDRA